MQRLNRYKYRVQKINLKNYTNNIMASNHNTSEIEMKQDVNFIVIIQKMFIFYLINFVLCYLIPYLKNGLKIKSIRK